MGHERFFTGVLVLIAGAALLFLTNLAIDDVNWPDGIRVGNAVILFAHSVVALGLIGLVAAAWSSDRVPADRLSRHVLLVLAGVFVIQAGWGVALALALLSGVLVWQQLRSPAADTAPESATSADARAETPDESTDSPSP